MANEMTNREKVKKVILDWINDNLDEVTEEAWNSTDFPDVSSLNAADIGAENIQVEISLFLEQMLLGD